MGSREKKKNETLEEEEEEENERSTDVRAASWLSDHMRTPVRLIQRIQPPSGRTIKSDDSGCFRRPVRVRRRSGGTRSNERTNEIEIRTESHRHHPDSMKVGRFNYGFIVDDIIMSEHPIIARELKSKKKLEFGRSIELCKDVQTGTPRSDNSVRSDDKKKR